MARPHDEDSQNDDEVGMSIDTSGDIGVGIGSGLTIDSDGDIGINLGGGLTIDSDGDLGFKL